MQTDRKRYHEYMKHALELTPGLAIHQAEVVGDVYKRQTPYCAIYC